MDMKPELYFRRAMFLPFVVCVLGAFTWRLAAWASTDASDANSVANTVTGFAGVVTIVHVVAVGPYAVFLLLASGWITRAHSLREIHVAIWAVPLLLALAVAGAVPFIAQFGGSFSGLASKAVVWGAGTAFVGYAYAALIEVGFLFGRGSGLIRP